GSCELSECPSKTCVVRVVRFLADASAVAAPELSLKARPGRTSLKLQSNPAQSVLCREHAQDLACAMLRRKGTVVARHRMGRDVERTHEARQPLIEQQDARFLLASQCAVVRGQL